jgi:hypothetical protein
MNRQEHLLTILGEECSELHQEICKALRFGVNEQRDLSTSNSERMFKEFNDLIAMVDMVNESLGAPVMHVDISLNARKRAKVEQYLEYSKDCGTLTDN